MKPPAYEGTEPYLFVSYAHRDRAQVFKVLDELTRRGYRLWYDDGIAPGSEWPEEVARHLDAAAMVMAFVTNNAMASRNCRREINFSLEREKPFLSVVLERTTMPLGMEMQLSTQQSVLRYGCDGWDDFVGKILSCPALVPCQAKGEAAQEAHSATTAGSSTGGGTFRRSAKPSASQKPRRARRAQRAASVDRPAEGPSARRKGCLVCAIALALLVAVPLVRMMASLGSAVVSSLHEVELSWGMKVSTATSTFIATGKTLTAEDWETICALDELSVLELSDCDLSACDFDAALAQGGLQGLHSIILKGSTGLDDYGFLGGLGVAKVDLARCAGFSDLAQLDVSALTRLDVSGTGVTDLAPLAGSSVETLLFSDTQVSSLEPLATMAQLWEVDGSRTQVSSLAPLAGLENLKRLAFDGCPLAEVPEVLAALSLAEVRLADTGLSDLRFLANCTRLSTLDLSGNARLADLSWLDAQNHDTLERLDLSRTGVVADDLAWLTRCTGLRELRLDGIALSDLDFCEVMGELETVSAVGCGLTDIGGLAECHELTRALLAGNGITDASPLGAVKRTSQTVLDLSCNELTTLEGLSAGIYRALLLYGNGEDIICSLTPDFDAYVTVVSWCDRVEDSPLAGARYGGKLYLVDCPDNQRLRTQDLLSGAQVTFVTADELWTLYAEDGFGYALGIDASSFLDLVVGGDQPTASATSGA